MYIYYITFLFIFVYFLTLHLFCIELYICKINCDNLLRVYTTVSLTVDNRIQMFVN